MEQQSTLIPPPEFFEDDGKRITSKFGPSLSWGQLTTPVYRIHTPAHGGIWVFHEGDKYPHKAWPFKEAVFAMDTIKRVIMSAAGFLVSRPLRYFIPLFVLMVYPWRKKMIHEAMAQFGSYTTLVFFSWGVVFKPQYFCDMAREIRRVGLPLAGDYEPGRQFVKAISMIFEFDDAYRYFVQDIFGLIDREAMLKNPSREAYRVLMIAAERGGSGTQAKFETFASIMRYLLMIPDIRDMARAFFKEVKLERMALDDIDWYRCLLWGNYKFKGISAEERVSIRMMIDAEWAKTLKDEKVEQKEFGGWPDIFIEAMGETVNIPKS